MENKSYDVLVNFDGAGSISSDPIVIAKGDYNSITLNFEMNISDYLLAMFYLVKPDGTYFADLIEDSSITFKDSNTFNKEGYYHYGIALYDEDSKLTNASKGLIKVVDNASETVSEEAVNDSQFPVLDNLINRVLQMQSSIEETISGIEEYNANAAEKLSIFNNNYQTKIDNINANILTIEEDAEETTGITFSDWGNSKRVEECIKNHFALTPDDKIYTVRFPLWETSNTCAGEKLDDNIGKYVHLATDTIREETNYSPAWESIDCNAVVDSNGVRHITALKGDANFKDTGEVDVFCLFRTYWQKIWVENGYLYISRSFVEREGYTINPLSVNKDGTYNSWFVIAKYVAGRIGSKIYSSKGLAPAHYLNIASAHNPSAECVSTNINYSGCITLGHARGNYYGAGLMAEYMHILTTFYLKFATKDTQSIMKGNTDNNYQYNVSQAEVDVNRVILTTEQANNIDLYSCVSVGDRGTYTDNDRRQSYMHNIVNDVRVIGKEVVDATHTALILDHANFNTTSTTYVSTMHEISGYSDYILGRNGSIGSNTNGKHGFVLDGIEIAVGGYEVAGNAFMDIVNASGDREVYYTNDSTKLTGTVATAKSTYEKSDLVIRPASLNGWKYITEYGFDTKDGIAVPTNAGQSGAGSAVGYADALNVDTGTSGQREFLLLGYLISGAYAGLSCVHANSSLTSGDWVILARLSINGVGGELTE
ncbi:MAG: hypothetical protein IJ068_06870 [Bacilli bacterium]|nr:hypothetical protein [Bacilli bacterium]